jgi:hypothetical protein
MSTRPGLGHRRLGKLMQVSTAQVGSVCWTRVQSASGSAVHLQVEPLAAHLATLGCAASCACARGWDMLAEGTSWHIASCAGVCWCTAQQSPVFQHKAWHVQSHSAVLKCWNKCVTIVDRGSVVGWLPILVTAFGNTVWLHRVDGRAGLPSHLLCIAACGYADRVGCVVMLVFWAGINSLLVVSAFAPSAFAPANTICAWNATQPIDTSLVCGVHLEAALFGKGERQAHHCNSDAISLHNVCAYDGCLVSSRSPQCLQSMPRHRPVVCNLLLLHVMELIQLHVCWNSYSCINVGCCPVSFLLQLASPAGTSASAAAKACVVNKVLLAHWCLQGVWFRAIGEPHSCVGYQVVIKHCNVACSCRMGFKHVVLQPSYVRLMSLIHAVRLPRRGHRCK